MSAGAHKRRAKGSVKTGANDRKDDLKQAATTSVKPDKEAPKSAMEETKVFLRNVLIICVVIVGPYALFRGYMWSMLSSGWFRPVVELEDPRQVLVVGTQSSGTTATAQSLNELGIEVSHESVDAQDDFARDGTVGWAQGIRYLANEETRASRLDLDTLCEKPLLRIMHSTQFEQSSQCSYRVEWDRCWQHECHSVFSRNFGCHPHCTRPPYFGRVLLQVRDPLRTVASLVVKYCENANAGSLPHPLKMATLEGLFADIPWREMKGGCKEVFGHYYVAYNQRVMDAFVDDTEGVFAWFRVEDTDPCALARLAGVLEPIPGSRDVTYGPTRARALKACAGKETSAVTEKPSGELKAHGSVNRGNTGKLRLAWSDFDDLPELKGRLQELARRFGYPDGES
ncbi:Hypothetical Protein FCC1311_094922 [Hondaea fermentalgiana]|uniref:Sulfotransferase domain-containing protein n=1 Tax=Hondaea fermentalgiana TaxID=2315210 RepID=A0A2R5GU36_9STRA|nr:Hypothetical Protein FCC1311_094922 [Hondaea fermentalgiana]|eukprot:GBG33268.1 Hypothetical Protein FCC1311_094922 [Hondaea fermentalgiana]